MTKGTSADTPTSTPERDEHPRPLRVFRAHWSLFLPALVIGVLYLGGWGVTWISGGGSGSIARLLLLVGTVAPPLLIAYAFFRWRSIHIALYDDHVLARRSPAGHPTHIPATIIHSVRLRRGLAGHLFDVATLVIRRTDGRRMVIPDVAGPDTVKAALEGLRDSPRSP